jgi:hypothetical protein
MAIQHERKSSPQLALERARLLFGCYRRSDAADPETYVVAVSALLSTFEADTVEHVTDPIVGLPASTNFVPTIKEIKDACEKHEQMKRTVIPFLQEQSRRRLEWESFGLEPEKTSYGAIRQITDAERAGVFRPKLEIVADNPEMSARVGDLMRGLVGQLGPVK